MGHDSTRSEPLLGKPQFRNGHHRCQHDQHPSGHMLLRTFSSIGVGFFTSFLHFQLLDL